MDARFLDSLQGSLAFRLHQATVLVDRAADRYLREAHGISYSLFVVLMTAGALGESSQREIADALAVTRASITQRVAELRSRGLVRVAPDASDARALRVSLTADGESLLAVAWRGLAGHDDGLDRDVDQVSLGRELNTLIRNARDHLGLAEGGAPGRSPSGGRVDGE